MGFGGINPCSQTHGAQKFWSEGQTPLKTLKTGNYTPVPIFAGACANDGTLVLSGTRQYFFFVKQSICVKESQSHLGPVTKLQNAIEIRELFCDWFEILKPNYSKINVTCLR